MKERNRILIGSPMTYLNMLLPVMIICFQSCHTYRASTTKTDTEPDWAPWVIKYERGPCYGQCPVFVFFLLSDHHGLIEVKGNLLEPGWYVADLDQEAVHEILMDIESESWWNPDYGDVPEIADLPGLSILYKHKDGLRWIAVKGRFTDEMGKVFQKLDHLVTEARWKPTTLRPVDPDVPEPTDVIVQLKEGVDVHTWMKQYDSFGIRLKKKINPKMQFYVVSKDPDLRSANDFLQYLKLDPDVIEAQWDYPVSQRN